MDRRSTGANGQWSCEANSLHYNPKRLRCLNRAKQVPPKGNSKVSPPAKLETCAVPKVFPELSNTRYAMSGRVNAKTPGGKVPAQAVEHSPGPQSPLFLRQVVMRYAVAVAFGFHTSDPADLLIAGKLLRNYFRAAGRVPLPQVAMDITIYICYGALLAIGFYPLIHRMTSTANGVISPVQKSKTLRYASIALCGLFANRDKMKQAVTIIANYVAGEGVTVSKALYQACRTLTLRR